MERLRPALDGPSGPPTFRCDSIADMFSSREAILDEINWWAENESRGILKFTHYSAQILSTSPLDLIRGKRNLECGWAFVEIPNVNHDPNKDRERNLGKNKVTITDSTDDLMCVELPSFVGIKLDNVVRRIEGRPLLNWGILKRNFWTANITLNNRYTSGGDRFRILHLEQEQIKIAEEEKQDIARQLRLQPI